MHKGTRINNNFVQGDKADFLFILIASTGLRTDKNTELALQIWM